MAFVVPTVLQVIEVEVPKYVSGYTEEEETQIKLAKQRIDARDLALEPVTLEEFKTVIAPWFRIHRTEEFILHPEKIKPIRVPKEAKPKVPKEKKLTKAQTQNKFQQCIMKMATGEAFTEEEAEFFKKQTGG